MRRLNQVTKELDKLQSLKNSLNSSFSEKSLRESIGLHKRILEREIASEKRWALQGYTITRLSGCPKIIVADETLNSSQESDVREADTSSNCKTSKGTDANENVDNFQEPDLNSNCQEEKYILVTNNGDRGIPHFVHMKL